MRTYRTCDITIKQQLGDYERPSTVKSFYEYTMKSKTLNLLLILASLVGYLEWSGNSHCFLYEAEWEIFSKVFSNPQSVMHPFTLLPFMGQVLLVVTLFQHRTSKTLTYVGIGCLGLLLVGMCAIGIISLKYKIVCSTIPFLVLSVFTIKHHSTKKIITLKGD